MGSIKRLKLNNQDIIPITHEQNVLDENGISLDTKLIQINNNIPTNISQLTNDSGFLTSIPVDNLVITNVSNGTLNLTTDKYQTSVIDSNVTINLPTVDNYTEISLFFSSSSDITITIENVKFHNIPTITSGKVYEFCFTYVDSNIGWLCGYVEYGNVIIEQDRVIAKYKFNNTLYDLMPEFNSEFIDYTYTDEVNGNETTRTIESDELPTLMRFGNSDNEITDRERSLLEVLELKTNNLTDSSYMFCSCLNLTYVNTSNWDTSNVTDMSNMFERCESLSSLDVSNWNTSKVTDMSWMFGYYDNGDETMALSSIDVSNWDTSSVTSMSGMFCYCRHLSSLDLSNFDTSSVTDMSYMLRGCNSLTTLDVSNWVTSSVTNMRELFYYCESLTSLDLSNWNTSKVTNMNYIFENCSSLTSLDLSNWNTDVLTDIDGLFFDCSKLISLDLSNWNLNNTTDYIEVFYNTPLLQEVLMYSSDYVSINKVIDNLPTRTEESYGTLYLNVLNESNINISTANSKYWNIVSENS